MKINILKVLSVFLAALITSVALLVFFTFLAKNLLSPSVYKFEICLRWAFFIGFSATYIIECAKIVFSSTHR